MIEELANELSIKHLGGPLRTIKPIVGHGEVNEVYILKSEATDAILRVNKPDEFERFKKERWCIEQSIFVGISGAEIYSLGKTPDYTYMLIEYIAGNNGKSIEASPKLWQELGKCLKIIHNIPVMGFGVNLHDILEGDKRQWKEYVQYNIDSLGSDDKLMRLGVLDKSTSKILKTMFMGLASKEFTFGLCHGDYSLANVIVDEQYKPHIIDWGSAQSHIVPHHDLGVILEESLDVDSEEFTALLHGYGMSKNDYSKIRSDISDLRILEAVDKLRWALDKSPESVEPHKNRLLNRLQSSQT